MAGLNRVSRAAAAAGAHYWTRELTAGEDGAAPRGNGAAAGGGAATSRGAERVVSLHVPTLETLIREYDARWLAHGAESTRRHQRTILRMALDALPPFPTPKNLRDWLSGKIERREIMATTANAYARVFQRMWSAAATEGHGLPNAFRAFTPFPEPPKVRRAIPGDAPGGRVGRVERMMALACEADTDRALLWWAYDVGCRIEELMGLRLAHDLDLDGGRVHVQGQRLPGKAWSARTKTKGSKRWINLSPEAVEWARRALRDPARRAWGGRWRGAGERAALAATFLFPHTARQLGRLLDRLRALDPDAFPRRVRGERCGSAWHAFRHSLASDMAEARGEDGRPSYRLEEIGAALGHTHSEWTRDYVESIRGRETYVDREALRAHRRGQRATFLDAAGVRGIGGQETGQDGRVAPGGAGGVESVACKGKRAAGAWWGSTHETPPSNIAHDRAPAPAARLPFPPYPVTPRKRGGAR